LPTAWTDHRKGFERDLSLRSPRINLAQEKGTGTSISPQRYFSKSANTPKPPPPPTPPKNEKPPPNPTAKPRRKSPQKQNNLSQRCSRVVQTTFIIFLMKNKKRCMAETPARTCYKKRGKWKNLKRGGTKGSSIGKKRELFCISLLTSYITFSS